MKKIYCLAGPTSFDILVKTHRGLLGLVAKPKSVATKKFNTMLKEINEEYRTTIINFGKYKLVMFAMAKLMEMETIEQNKVALYLFNCISL